MSEPSSSKQPEKSNYSRRAVIPATIVKSRRAVIPATIVKSRRAVIPATIVKGSSGCGCGRRKESIRSNNQDQTKLLVDSTVDKVGEETKSLIEQNNQEVIIKQSKSEEKPVVTSNPPHYKESKTQSFMDIIKEKLSKYFPKL